MGVDNFIKAGVTGSRQAKRARVLLAAKLDTQHGEIDCRLRDLSRKGALVECSPTPAADTELVFRRGGMAVPARVAWAAVGKIGLEFHYMIDEQDVLVQLKRTGNKAQQRFRRPGIKEEATEKDRALAKAWGIQVGIALPDNEP